MTPQRDKLYRKDEDMKNNIDIKTRKLDVNAVKNGGEVRTEGSGEKIGITSSDTRKSSAMDKHTLAVVRESYKAIRTNLILSVVKSGCKKIVVTSSVPGEGKTTTSSNLAISLAQTDKKVLLIDSDLRKPDVYRAMSLHNDPGFTNVLTGLVSFEDAVNETPYPNLHVLCAGISVPNPSELLACEATSEFISQMEEKYDYVIFDTPPINTVSDALPIIRLSDGTVMVVRQNNSTTTEIEKAIKSIEFINGRILGFVFNGARGEKKQSSYDSYRYADTRK